MTVADDFALILDALEPRGWTEPDIWEEDTLAPARVAYKRVETEVFGTVREAREMLGRFADWQDGDDEFGWCLVCSRPAFRRHAPDCELAALLTRLEMTA